MEYPEGVVLIGGGAVDPADLARARHLAPGLIAADGGGDRALQLGLMPDRVIGDIDSLSSAAQRRLGGRVMRIAEQESTDFGKCLRHVRAPFYICVGFAGLRLDHTLAALSEVASRPDQTVLLLAEDEVAFRAPPDVTMLLPPGERLSIFPFGPASGRSEGLRWPIDGLDFAPDARIGTSNEVIAAAAPVPVRIAMQGPALILLPKRHLEAVLAALAGR